MAWEWDKKAVSAILYFIIYSEYVCSLVQDWFNVKIEYYAVLTEELIEFFIVTGGEEIDVQVLYASGKINGRNPIPAPHKHSIWYKSAN